MSNMTIDTIRYNIWDPTGNITALVETAIPVSEQPAAAAAIMECRPEVEQVGFVDFSDGVRLRMAGGEFCGNATMSAAAMWLMKHQTDGTSVRVRVSGVSEPIQVDLTTPADDGEEKGCYRAAVHMPSALAVEEIDLRSPVSGADRVLCGRLPLVRLPGIAHLIVEPGSVWRMLLNERETAESVILRWCGELGVESLGMIFVDEVGQGAGAADKRVCEAIPLVCVKKSSTVFWEHSCASGSAACAAALAHSTGADIDITLHQPGGTMRVSFERGSGQTILCGATRLISDSQTIRFTD